jgi:uncharacterized protein (DUF924 family)
MTGVATMAGDIANADPAAWCDDVLHFWFDELSVDHWWCKDDALDARIRERFLGLYAALASRRAAAIVEPRVALATVIVLDQFPRNMFRGDARAYASDAQARAVARTAIAAGLDHALSRDGRLFLYMPLQHSEDAADQRIGVELVSALGDDEWTRIALAHQRIIDRFGRFPHRNAVLGRRSTAEETVSLGEPMGSF